MTKMILALAMASSAAHAATIGQTCTPQPGRGNFQETIYSTNVDGVAQECGRTYIPPMPNSTWRATIYGSVTPYDGSTESAVKNWLVLQTLPVFPTH